MTTEAGLSSRQARAFAKVAGSRVRIADRRMREVYSLLDNGNARRALQEIDKISKKIGPITNILAALRCLSLSQLGRAREAGQLFDSLAEDHFASIKDDPESVEVLAMYLQQNNRIAPLVEMYRSVVSSAKQGLSEPNLLQLLHALLLTPNAHEPQRHVITQLYQATRKPSYHKWTVVTLLDQIGRDHPAASRDSGILFKLANRVRQSFLPGSVCFEVAVGGFDPDHRAVIARADEVGTALDPSLSDVCNRVRAKAYIQHAVESDLTSVFAFVRREINWCCINWDLFRDLLTRLVGLVDSTTLIDFLESVRTFRNNRSPPAGDVWTRVYPDEADAINQLVNAVSAGAFEATGWETRSPNEEASPDADEDDLELIASVNESVLSMAMIHVSVLTESPQLPIELRMYIIHFGFQDNACHFDLSCVLERNSPESNRKLARFLLYDSVVYSLKWQQLTSNASVQRAATTLLFLLNYLDPLVLHEDLRLSHFRGGAATLSCGLSLLEKMYYVLAATDVDLDGFPMSREGSPLVLPNWITTEQALRGVSGENKIPSGCTNEGAVVESPDSMPSPFDYMILMRELLSKRPRNFFTDSISLLSSFSEMPDPSLFMNHLFALVDMDSSSNDNFYIDLIALRMYSLCSAFRCLHDRFSRLGIRNVQCRSLAHLYVHEPMRTASWSQGIAELSRMLKAMLVETSDMAQCILHVLGAAGDNSDLDCGTMKVAEQMFTCHRNINVIAAEVNLACCRLLSQNEDDPVELPLAAHCIGNKLIDLRDFKPLGQFCVQEHHLNRQIELSMETGQYILSLRAAILLKLSHGVSAMPELRPAPPSRKHFSCFHGPSADGSFVLIELQLDKVVIAHLDIDLAVSERCSECAREVRLLMDRQTMCMGRLDDSHPHGVGQMVEMMSITCEFCFYCVRLLKKAASSEQQGEQSAQKNKAALKKIWALLLSNLKLACMQQLNKAARFEELGKAFGESAQAIVTQINMSHRFTFAQLNSFVHKCLGTLGRI